MFTFLAIAVILITVFLVDWRVRSRALGRRDK
jgi:hypothetical protein